MKTGRVIAEFKDRYDVSVHPEVYSSEVLGHLRFTAESRADLPAVGDWVQIEPFDGAHAIIHSINDRKNILERQAVGGHGEAQIIATNVDIAFIVQGLDRDFNINRIERYLTLCNAHDIEPIIILTKADLISKPQLEENLDDLKNRMIDIPVLVISNETHQGYESLKKHLIPNKTYCMLGSSGVGKSTMINNLVGEDVLETKSISTSTHKGRHTTTHRELFTLPNGSYIIDNPGMREVGMTDADSGVDKTFDVIADLEKECRFSDCTHTSEIGCKVLEALEHGEISESYFENYHKLSREAAHFESTAAERRKKDKQIGKLIKNYKKGGFNH